MEQRMGGTRAETRKITRFALACLSLLLPACVDCFDDGELEASYRAGQASARQVNEQEFSRGYDQGLALTYDDGAYDGDVVGYDDGFYDGYHSPWGYPRGADDGYAGGHTDGLLDPFACGEGSSKGFANGDADGYAFGFDEAYDPSFDDGYDAGYTDGAGSCNGFRAASQGPDPKDLDTCEARGYRRELDRNAFPRGFDAGKVDNPEYQSGYSTAYVWAYDAGALDGERQGYDDGFVDGYDAGFIDGYDVSFYLCYDQAYPDGYDQAYPDGYDDGLSAGYDEGYDAGYYDALDQCPE